MRLPRLAQAFLGRTGPTREEIQRAQQPVPPCARPGGPHPGGKDLGLGHLAGGDQDLQRVQQAAIRRRGMAARRRRLHQPGSLPAPSCPAGGPPGRPSQGHWPGRRRGRPPPPPGAAAPGADSTKPAACSCNWRRRAGLRSPYTARCTSSRLNSILARAPAHCSTKIPAATASSSPGRGSSRPASPAAAASSQRWPSTAAAATSSRAARLSAPTRRSTAPARGRGTRSTPRANPGPQSRTPQAPPGSATGYRPFPPADGNGPARQLPQPQRPTQRRHLPGPQTA